MSDSGETSEEFTHSVIQKFFNTEMEENLNDQLSIYESDNSDMKGHKWRASYGGFVEGHSDWHRGHMRRGIPSDWTEDFVVQLEDSTGAQTEVRVHVDKSQVEIKPFEKKFLV